MPRIEKRKRERLWWQEENENQFADGEKLTEAYDPSRLKAGCDGRNGPDIKSMYAKKGDKRFDNLGSGTAGAEKPKKGDSDSKKVVVKEDKKRVREAGFDDEPDMEDNFDNEVPPEMDDFDDEGMGDEGMDDEMPGEEGAEEIADDIHIEISGQRFKLIPEEPEGEEGMEGEDLDGGDELGGEEPGLEGMDVGAEDQDIEQMESTKKSKKSISEAKTRKADYIRKLLKMKAFAEGQLNELFTGDYVQTLDASGKLPGMNFKPVAGDKDFAVVDRAASGKQYTVTDSKSPYEPGSDAKGQTGGKVQKPATKEDFKKWLNAQKKKIDEEEGQEDPGKTSEDFNLEDEFVGEMAPKDFVAAPEIK
jgi:hypothetical protein